MILSRRIGVVMALLATALSAPAHAAERAEAIDRTTLRVCADPASPPMSSEDGKGFENEIAELFARELGVKVQYSWFPGAMGFYRRTLNARRCDIVMGAAVGMEMAATTDPYYRSSYVLLTRSADGVTAARLDDPALRARKLGVQARTPATDILARLGVLDSIRSYDLMVDTRHISVAREMLDDLLAKRIDGAVLWGPIAGELAAAHPELRLTILSAGPGDMPLAFDIGMAVRFGEPAWRARINRFIHDRRAQIVAILTAHHVPRLPLTETK